MPQVRKLPIAAYDPRIFELMIAGGKSRIEITFDNPSTPVKLAQRLHAARRRLAEAHDPREVACYRASIAAKGNTLVIKPRDSEFEAAFAAAGVQKLDPATIPESAREPEISEPSKDSINSFIASIGGKPQTK